MTEHFDVVVVGAGPGGYIAAIRAAQLGKRVAVVEEKYWGGVCLNVGCIPSKALLRNAEMASTLVHEREALGITGDAGMTFDAAHRRSRAVSERMAGGVHYLMKKNGINEIHGWATFTGPRSLRVRGADGSEVEVTGENVVIATGATNRLLPGTALSDRVVTYEEQILEDTLPDSIVIAGSGAIGVEFAYVMASFGVDVTIVEFQERMVPTEDVEVSKELQKHYRKLGVKVLCGTRVEGVDDSGDKVAVTLAPVAGGPEKVLETDKVLQAIGFAPRLDGYGLEATGVTTTGGAIAVDGRGRTNVPGVYAIGDVTGKLMLAHTAEAMGVVAAETLAGAETVEIDVDMIPRATYCQPQIASFGFTEQQARDMGVDVTTAKFPFSANGKAWGMGHATGFVKLVAEADTHLLLGAHMIGPEVTELLPVLTLAQQSGLTAEQVGRNVFAHPTLTEAVKEAAHGIVGHMLNL